MRKKLATYFYRGPKKEKSWRKADIIQYAYLSFLLCFVLGIFGANLLQKGTGAGGWSSYWLENLRYQEIGKSELFYFIFGKRIPVFLLFLLLSFTNLSVFLGIAYIGWQGFCVGTLMSSAVMAYGIKGMLLILVGMFPHYIFYFLLYFCYLWLMRERKSGQRLPQAAGKRKLLYVLCGILFFFIFVTGIFLESYVNPFFIKKYLKII